MLNDKMIELGEKRSIIREIFEYGKIRSEEIGRENVFDFSLGNPSINPPEIISDTIKDLLKTDNLSLVHGYTSAQGDIMVRKVISDNLNKKYNTNFSYTDLYMTCGAAASLTISLKALMKDNDECIIFAPYFTEYKVFIENANGIPVVVKPDYNTLEIDLVDLERKISEKTKCVIINSPNNPSGVVYSSDTIKKLSEILDKAQKKYNTDIYLISDEPYRELVYDDVKVPFISNYYNNSIITYSYSKALSLPGERIGYIALSPLCKNKDKVYSAICGAGRSLGFVCAPSLFQHVIEKCDGITVDVNIYKENRDILYNGLKEMGYECIYPKGAFYLLVKSFNGNAYDFYELAKKYDILFVPCDNFGISGYVRLAYCLDKNKIIKSLPNFNKMIKENKNV